MGAQIALGHLAIFSGNKKNKIQEKIVKIAKAVTVETKLK